MNTSRTPLPSGSTASHDFKRDQRSVLNRITYTTLHNTKRYTVYGTVYSRKRKSHTSSSRATAALARRPARPGPALVGLLGRPPVHGPELGHVLPHEHLGLGAHRVRHHQLLHGPAVLQLLQHHEVGQLPDRVTAQPGPGEARPGEGHLAKVELRRPGGVSGDGRTLSYRESRFRRDAPPNDFKKRSADESIERQRDAEAPPTFRARCLKSAVQVMRPALASEWR